MLSVFDIFKIGIGPSSSHTVGPMRAAKMFAEKLGAEKLLNRTRRVQAELFGSLGLTGRGHGSDRAVILGLQGETPEDVELDSIPRRLAELQARRRLTLPSGDEIEFDPARDIIFHRRQSLPAHPNGMRFTARDAADAVLIQAQYYSVGGGFVQSGETALGNQDRRGCAALDAAAVGGNTAGGGCATHELNTAGGGCATFAAGDAPTAESADSCPFPFRSARELIAHCDREKIGVDALMLANELARCSHEELEAGLRRLWGAMEQCIRAGCANSGLLPGALQVKRRAPEIYRRLLQKQQAAADAPGAGAIDPTAVLDWVSLYAIAVNEENAAGGRVVTAPTNGAAGIVPAVIQYYLNFSGGAKPEDVGRFLLTAAAIALLFKENASISGADVGCQGEVGVACSMAAAGLAQVLGGTPAQVENAAEIGMEHNLGLTCDPVGGLVQIPCIERNAIGAVKAIGAARLALQGDGSHRVSLDRVIRTMYQTGQDMQTKYKETSRGGLAVNVIEC